MLSSDVSTDRRRIDWAWRIAMALLVGAILIGGTFVALKLHALYRVQLDMSALMADHTKLREDLTRQDALYSDRFDSLERVLFGDVVVKLMEKEAKPVQAPPRLQQWMVNRDKDLRERLERIERRLLQIEAGK